MNESNKFNETMSLAPRARWAEIRKEFSKALGQARSGLTILDHSAYLELVPESERPGLEKELEAIEQSFRSGETVVERVESGTNVDSSPQVNAAPDRARPLIGRVLDPRAWRRGKIKWFVDAPS